MVFFFWNCKIMHHVLPGVRAHGMYILLYIVIVGGPRQTAKLTWARTGPTQNDRKWVYMECLWALERNSAVSKGISGFSRILILQEKEEPQPVQGKEWEKLVWDSVLDGEFWVKCVLFVEEMKDVLQLQSTLTIFFVPCTATPLCLWFCSSMVCPVLRFTFDKDLSRAGYS